MCFFLVIRSLIIIFVAEMRLKTFFWCILLTLLLPLEALAADGSKGELLANEADSLYSLQQYAEAQRVAAQALNAMRSERNAEGEADCLNLLAIINIRLGDFNEAAKYAKQCYVLDEKSGDPDAMSSSLNTLAAIYMSMRQPKEAEKYVLKGIEYSKKADNPQRLAILHGMASEVYHYLKQDERSLQYATMAYEMEQKLGRKDKMAVRQAERASALIALKRHDEARKALDEAIPGLRASGNIHSLGIACNQMGLMLHNEGNDAEAVTYFNEALNIFLAQHDLYNEAMSRQGLYESLRHTDPDKAMEHNDRYMALRDSIYDKDTGELLTKYAVEYGYDQLQAENISLLQMRRIYLIVGVIMLLALLGFGLWRSRRDRLRMQELIRQIENMRIAEVGEVEPQIKEETEQNSQEDVATEDRLFVMRLVQVVNDGLSTGQYGVEAVASEMNMSVQTFRRRLMSVTGESPKAFISAIQMERAAKFLTDNPDMSIARVATLCGYDETNSFGRSFKRAYGVTPSQYRGQ